MIVQSQLNKLKNCTQNIHFFKYTIHSIRQFLIILSEREIFWDEKENDVLQQSRISFLSLRVALNTILIMQANHNYFFLT